MTKEALKLALEMVQKKMYAHAEMYLKEALAQDALQALHDENERLGLYEQHSLPEQEPVAFVHGDDLDNLLDDRLAFIQRTKSGHRKTALYTTPPQEQLHCDMRPWKRPWVSLTDEESVELMRQVPYLTIGGLLAVEAKLKEKNNE